MKKLLLLAAMAGMMFSVNAQDLTIATNHDNGVVKIIQDGRFAPITQNIGNTSSTTQVYLGEVDFGTTGDKYQAAGVRFANGWDGNSSYAILSAGETLETAVPFTQVKLAYTSQYDVYQTVAGKMACMTTDTTQWAGGAPATTGATYTKPTGVQKVWMTFVNGAGNIRAVYFWETAPAAADYAEGGVRLLNPNEKSDYASKSITLSGASSTLVSSPSTDTRWDSDSWGWTQSDVVVNYGEVDFGNGEYNQIVPYFRHWSENNADYVEFYIDDASVAANKIGEVFTGLELRDKDGVKLFPFAASISTVTGKHNLYVKWVGGSTNVADIDLVKGTPWVVAPTCGLVYENETPTDSALHYTFRTPTPDGMTALDVEIKNKGQREGAGNVGYTGNGTVLKLSGVDFKKGYNKILVTHSSDKTWIDYIENANFSYYLDLEQTEASSVMVKEDIDWANINNYVADKTPVAKVRIQGTSSWGTQLTTKGDLDPNVVGVHDVYVVYNITTSDAGANVFDIYLDEPVVSTAINDVNTVKAASVRKVIENGQVVIYNGDVKYNIMGAQIK